MANKNHHKGKPVVKVSGERRRKESGTPTLKPVEKSANQGSRANGAQGGVTNSKLAREDEH